MDNYRGLFPVLLIGMASVTVIDTLGAVASRKLRFEYGYLTVLSLSVYTYIGYIVSLDFGLEPAIGTNCLIGLYDATVGLWLSARMGAFSKNPALHREAKGIFSIVTMLMVALIFSTIGYGLTFV